MATNRNPGWMQSAGDELLSRAKTISTSSVKAQLARFGAAHRAFLAAQGKTNTAKDAELDQRFLRGELDAKQDAAIDTLASRLAGDGFPRVNPFKAFAAKAPNILKALGDDAEAAAALKLARAVQKHRQASAGAKKAAQVLGKAAQAVLGASKAVAPAAAESFVRRSQRDALVAEWSKAYSLLRIASQLTEASGGEPLHSTLFAHARKPAKKPAPAPAPATAAA